MRAVRVGCSGWNYDDWRGRLYPEGLAKTRWLERYAEEFDTVEVNSTFYRLPSRDAVARWAEQTPSGFLFAAKASRYLTHVRRLRDVGEGIARMNERLEPLAAAGKLGPARVAAPAELSARRRAARGIAAPCCAAGGTASSSVTRAGSTTTCTRACGTRGVALVIADHPKWPFQAHELTADWTLVRLHHGHRGRRGNYSRTELEEWARRIRRWRRRAEVLVYLNNDWEGFAVENARTLRRLLRRAPGG